MSVFLQFEEFMTSDPALKPHRRDLYHTEGPGYIIVRNYLSAPYIEHLRNYWVHSPPSPAMADTQPIEPKVVGQRPFAAYFDRRTCYHNYLWNKPFDEVSHSICFGVTLLRNQLQQSSIYFNLAPNGNRLASYRLLLSKDYKPEDIEVPSHEDFQEEKYKLHEAESQYYLQATLFLSEHGVDYTGNGFFFVTNTGQKIYPGVDLNLKPGDLMVWRYINAHGVEATQTLPDGIGFARMTFPHEDIKIPEVRIQKPKKLKRLGQKLKKLLTGAS